MVEPTLSSTLTTLKLVVADYLGYGLTAGSWATDQTTRLDMICKSGIRQFLFPPMTRLTPRGFYWKFLVKDATATTVAATAVVQFPDDFYCLVGKPCFFNETYTSSQTLEMIDYVRYKQLIEQHGLRQDTPKYFMVARVSTSMTGATNVKSGMALFPIPPDNSYDIVYQYVMIPDYPVVPATQYLPGGPAHGNTLESSCLAIAEYRLNGVHGDKWQQFMTDLEGSVNLDGAIQEGPLGALRDLFAPEGVRTWPASVTVLYNGVPV